MCRQRNNSVTKFLLIGGLFLILVNVVYVRIYIQTPKDHRYTGIGFEAAADKFVYYSMIRQGAEGRLFMQNVQTSEPQRGLLFSPHWYLIGITARILHIPISLSYHLYRLIAIVGFLVLLSAFVKKLFPEPRYQIGAFAMALFSSGMGWFYFITHPYIADTTVHWMQYFNQTPIDLYVTEFSAFSNALQSPLFILSHLLIFLVWILFLRDDTSLRARTALLCIVALFGSIHPYDLLLVAVVTSALAMIEVPQRGISRAASRLWPIVLGVCIAALYQVISFMREPALSGWLSQNIALSPSLGNYLWGIGMVGPLAVLGVWYLARSRDIQNPYWRLTLIWALTIPVLIYLPLSVNRRFANTLLIPLSLLAWYGLLHLLRSIRPYLMRVAVGMICVMLLFSGTLYQLAQHLFYIPTLDEKYNYFIDPYMSGAMDIMRRRLTYGDVLLPSIGFMGIFSAAYAPTKVFVGHAHQTVQFELKTNQMDWFFAEPQTDTSLENRRIFLKKNGITAIIVYKPSMRVSYDWLDTFPGIERIYDSVVARIFKVTL